MKETKKRLKEIKIDSTYGKKKHFNAADRIERYHYFLGIPLVLLNLLTGSAIFYVIVNVQTSWIKYIPLGLALFTSVLSGLQTFFNFSKKIEGHRRIGNKYLFIMKECSRTIGYISDGIIEQKDIVKTIEKIAEKVDNTNQEAEGYPTNQADYKKAQEGISKKEEEKYTKKELAL